MVTKLSLHILISQRSISANLEDEKKNRLKVAAGQKRKALSDEVSELKVKRKALQSDAEALSAAADDFSDQAEKLQKLTLVAKANSM